MRLKLGERETIVCTYAKPAHGPGWRNQPLWVIIRDYDGSLREECLQPSQQGPDVRRIYGIAAEVHEAMLSAVGKVVSRRARK
jgi:hypothetical protein